MKTSRKKLLVIMLAAATLAVLAGCSGKKEVHKINFITSPAYEAEEIPLPVQTGDLLGCCTDGETMFILADEKVGEEVKTSLSRVSLTDGTAVRMEAFQATVVPDGGFKNTLGPILAPDGTLWLYEMWTINYFDLPEDFDETKESKVKYLTHHEDFHHLRQLDTKSGKEKKIIDLSDAVRTLEINNISDVSGVALDGKGNIYFAGNGGVAVINQKMEHLFTLEASLPRPDGYGSSGSPLVTLPDGAVAALTVQPGAARVVRPIDAGAKDWARTRYDLAGTTTSVLYTGTSGFLFYYIQGSTLYAWEPEAEEGRKLLDWSAAQLKGGVMCFVPMEQGKMAVTERVYKTDLAEDEDPFYSDGIRFSILSPSKKMPNEGKTSIIYGTLWADDMTRARIKRFNGSSDQYVIEIREYYNGGTTESAMARLNADVMSGNAPDIWSSSLPIALYARKGLMEDLWPYIDNDPELGRDALMTHVLDCASVDGKLYQVGNSFEIETLVGCVSIVGDRTDWTMDEMLEAYRSLPEGSALLEPVYNNFSSCINTFLSANESHWIDWSTGECRFDTEEFKSLLELCAGIDQYASAGTDDYMPTRNPDGGKAMREGRQLLTTAIISSPDSILYHEALCGGPESIRDYMTRLNDAGIVYTRRDSDGNLLPEDTVCCDALGDEIRARESGKFRGNMPMDDDIRFGTVEDSGYASYIGYPSDMGSGSGFIFLGGSLGISASSKVKEGAWEYVRKLLLPDGTAAVKGDGIMSYDGANGFPINKEAFENYLRPDVSWFKDANGEYVLDQDGNRIEETDYPEAVGYPVTIAYYPTTLSEEQANRFMELYESVDHMSQTFSTVLDIVREQAQPYLAGDKSLDETADLIQRRVSLYVNENR